MSENLLIVRYDRQKLSIEKLIGYGTWWSSALTCNKARCLGRRRCPECFGIPGISVPGDRTDLCQCSHNDVDKRRRSNLD